MEKIGGAPLMCDWQMARLVMVIVSQPHSGRRSCRKFACEVTVGFTINNAGPHLELRHERHKFGQFIDLAGEPDLTCPTLAEFTDHDMLLLADVDSHVAR